MGYGDLGCCGSKTKTPNIDKLAADGIRFKRSFGSHRVFTQPSGIAYRSEAETSAAGGVPLRSVDSCTIAPQAEPIRVALRASGSVFIHSVAHATGKDMSASNDEPSHESSGLARLF
ncbi:hypothetical protein [Novipirellula aureliae]|uniref:hypothetical protein n=1 Tax=Novipirellula aureliae TaxID=2527966 RepID=UPI001E40D676|nr:hypothetical protein [Novipirellula aureliae]